MAGSLSEIKRRIISIQKTSHITGAMQTVSAAELTKFEQAAQDPQTYASKIRQATTDLLKSELINGSKNPASAARSVKKTGYIVITSGKGLVGGCNSKILKAMMDLIQEYHAEDDNYVIVAIGGIGADLFKARGMSVVFELCSLEDQPSFEQVGNIISKSVEMYKNELFNELYACYNHHVNSLTSQVRVQQAPSIVELDADEAAEERTTGFELEPSRELILERPLPQYTESPIYGAIVDAKTAEYVTGMIAMQTATDNTKNIITDLTTQHGRARQATITNEIIEIIAGANALE